MKDFKKGSYKDNQRLERRNNAIWQLAVLESCTVDEIAEIFKINRTRVKHILDRKYKENLKAVKAYKKEKDL